MNTNDRREFAEALNQLFSIYGDEVTDRMRNSWWGILSPYTLNAVKAAMNLHAGDKKRGMYRPTPADIRVHLEDTIPEMMRSRRNAILRDAMERSSPLREGIARVDNDVFLGLLKREEADLRIDAMKAKIRAIYGEPDVIMATAPEASMRDEAVIASADRIPDVVRKALGWLGKKRD